MLALTAGDRTVELSRSAAVRFSTLLADVCGEFPDAATATVPIPLASTDAESVRYFCDMCHFLEGAVDAERIAMARLGVEQVERKARELDPTLLPLVAVARLANLANYLDAAVIVDACLAVIVARFTGKDPRGFAEAFSAIAN